MIVPMTTRSEPDGFQLEIGEVMLTVRINTPMGVQGSLAYKENGETMIVSFHQTQSGFTIHDPEPLP